MERICFRLQVRPEHREAYIRRHAEVWPDMLTALHETGWRNYSLFLGEDGLLIGYVETDDLEACLRGMEEREVNARWQADMAPYFADLDGSRPDEGFVRLTEIFNLADQLHAGGTPDNG